MDVSILSADWTFYLFSADYHRNLPPYFSGAIRLSIPYFLVSSILKRSILRSCLAEYVGHKENPPTSSVTLFGRFVPSFTGILPTGLSTGECFLVSILRHCCNLCRIDFLGSLVNLYPITIHLEII